MLKTPDALSSTAKGYSIGILMGIVTVVGCASTGFPWLYYNAQMPESCYDQGKLLGKTGSGGWPDLSLSECKPDPVPSGSPTPGRPSPVLLKCMTMKADDFYSLRADDEKCHADLQICQQGPMPTGRP